jgi:hypothetical protein
VVARILLKGRRGNREEFLAYFKNFEVGPTHFE